MKIVKNTLTTAFIIFPLLMTGCSAAENPVDNDQKNKSQITESDQQSDDTADTEAENEENVDQEVNEKKAANPEDVMDPVNSAEQLYGVWTVTNISDVSQTLTFNSDGVYEDFSRVDSDSESDNLRSGTFSVDNGTVRLTEQSFKVGPDDLSFTISDPEYSFKALTDGSFLILEGLDHSRITYVLEKSS